MAADGTLTVSSDGGRSWRRRGDLQAQPAAFTAGGDALHVADGEGRIFYSEDAGRTWTVRAQP